MSDKPDLVDQHLRAALQAQFGFTDDPEINAAMLERAAKSVDIAHANMREERWLSREPASRWQRLWSRWGVRFTSGKEAFGAPVAALASAVALCVGAAIWWATSFYAEDSAEQLRGVASVQTWIPAIPPTPEASANELAAALQNLGCSASLSIEANQLILTVNTSRCDREGQASVILDSRGLGVDLNGNARIIVKNRP